MMVKIRTQHNLIVQISGLSSIIIIALVIRLFFVINFPEKDRYGLGPFDDSALYNELAVHLFMGDGFVNIDYKDTSEHNINKPAFSRGPAYPFFMYMVYKFFVNSTDTLSLETWHVAWDKVRIVQCVLDSFCCVLVFFIVKSIYPKSVWSPLISAGLYGLSFYNIYYTKVLLTETLTTFLITLFILIAIFGIIKKEMRWFFYAGIIYGFVLLCRTEYSFFVLVFVLFLFSIKKNNKKIFIRNIAIYLIGVAVSVLPWSFRNYVVFKRPILISVGGLGESIYWGTFENNENWIGWGAFS